MLPAGFVLLVELKRPKRGVLSARQVRWLDKCARLGATARVCSSIASVRELSAAIDAT